MGALETVLQAPSVYGQVALNPGEHAWIVVSRSRETWHEHPWKGHWTIERVGDEKLVTFIAQRTISPDFGEVPDRLGPYCRPHPTLRR